MEILVIAVLIAWLTAGDKDKRERSKKAAKKIKGLTPSESKKRVAAYRRAHKRLITAGREAGTGSKEFASAMRGQERAWNRLSRRDQRRYHKNK